MGMGIGKRIVLGLAALCAASLCAGEVEASVVYGFVFPGNRNLNLDNPGTGGGSTFVQTRFAGPWQEPSVELAWEVARYQAMKVWVRTGYGASSRGRDYAKVGLETGSTGIASETFSGRAKVSQALGGLGLTFDSGQLGEYGVALLYRLNHITLDGTLTTAVYGSAGLMPVATGYARNASVSDLDLRLSMGLVQVFPTCKLFQRISLDWGLGGNTGTVNGDATDWQLNANYLARLKPAAGFQFAFGVRL